MKKRVIHLIVVVLLALSLTACAKSLEQQIAEQLELGQKYLTELNYEEAIVAFTKVIELDEKNVDAYIGRGQVYEAMAQAAGEENADGKTYYEQAATDYEQVLSLSSADSFAYERLLTIYQITDNLEEIKNLAESDLNEITDEAVLESLGQIKTALEALKKISDACEAGETDRVFELMDREEFDVLLAFAKEMGYPVFKMENSKGLGIYPVKTENYGENLIYFGDYQNGQRHGHGLWVGSKDGKNYWAEGEWRNDKPNGSQEARWRWSSFRENLITCAIIGSVENGLWNGEALRMYEEKERNREFPISFEYGKYIVLDVTEDINGTVLYVVSVSGTPDEYGFPESMVIHNPDEIEGIEGFRNH